jgi:hypothetical protein
MLNIFISITKHAGGDEASMAMMVEMSDVRDVALVEVVGSSPTCLWVCLG